MNLSTGAVRGVPAARSYWRANWRNHATAAAVGVFLALVGALGTLAGSLMDRLIFWTALLLAGSICASILNMVISRRRRVGESNIRRWTVVTICIAAPMSLLSWALAQFLFDAGAPTTLPYFGWGATVITGAMTALMMAINTPGPETRGADAAPSESTIRLFDRIPAEFRSAQIYAVSAEDHYLRVHTSRGSTLILLRLSDAIAELEGIEGAQVHRSWWVARDAVVGMRKIDRKRMLLLKGEVQAPVSRPNVMAVRRSGWLPLG